MIDDERLKAEQDVLKKILLDNIYRFMDMDTLRPYIIMAAKTNRGNLYTLRIDLENFPEMVPNMYVKNRILLKLGLPVFENDEVLKTLYYKDDMIGIRHYSKEAWSYGIALSCIH